MNKLKKLNLNQLSKNDLDKREMNALRGGEQCCLCGCNYQNHGGSSVADNSAANNAGDLHSPGSGGHWSGSAS